MPSGFDSHGVHNIPVSFNGRTEAFEASHDGFDSYDWYHLLRLELDGKAVDF